MAAPLGERVTRVEVRLDTVEADVAAARDNVKWVARAVAVAFLAPLATLIVRAVSK